jgi:hypothetical protein
MEPIHEELFAGVFLKDGLDEALQIIRLSDSVNRGGGKLAPDAVKVNSLYPRARPNPDE